LTLPTQKLYTNEFGTVNSRSALQCTYHENT
jgi:hypothetical protein